MIEKGKIKIDSVTTGFFLVVFLYRIFHQNRTKHVPKMMLK